jgi:hypothetical protein
MGRKREITLNHIERAARWAIRARKAKKAIKIDGTMRTFCMSFYDCGTACCIAGASALIAGVPSPESAGFELHDRLSGWERSNPHFDADWIRGTKAERRLANAMNSNVPESTAPERVLKACAAIRKERAKRKASS